MIIITTIKNIVVSVHHEIITIRSSPSSPSPYIVTWSGLQCALEATEEEKEDVLQKILAPGHDPEIYCSKPSKTIFGLVYYRNIKTAKYMILSIVLIMIVILIIMVILVLIAIPLEVAGACHLLEPPV